MGEKMVDLRSLALMYFCCYIVVIHVRFKIVIVNVTTLSHLDYRVRFLETS